MLFAVLTASLLLTIGISIFNISLKELTISTNTRESQIAFFAADSARECALYWDIKKGAFPACLDGACALKTTTTEIPMCNGIPRVITPDETPPSIIYVLPTFFKYDAGNSLEPESDITIIKTFDSGSGNIITTISARGHNTGEKGRRLERAIEQMSTD
jgi:hypothetical protein